MIILVLEASSTSAKAMLVDTVKQTHSIKTLPYAPGTHNNADAIFEQILQAGKTLSQGQYVEMIALSSVWHSLLICDQEMHAKSSIWNWYDTDASVLCNTLRSNESYVREFYQQTGCMVHSIYPYFKLMHFKDKGIFSNNDRITDQGTHMFYHLTGSYTTTLSLASGTGFLDIHNQTYHKRAEAEIGISIDSQLPKLVGFGYTAPLSEKAAHLLGMKAGIPVLPCYPDGGLNQVGSDATDLGIMTISMGTSGAIRLASDKPYLPDNMNTWCYLSPKGYLAGAATSGCCNCVDWVKGSLFDAKTSYKSIESKMELSKPVPTFLPFLYGERCPGWNDERLAAFLDLKPSHSAIDQYQAVLEGVIFNLLQCYESLTASDLPINTIKLSGGVLNSPRWKQMCADIFAVPLTEDPVSQTSLVGGAKLAMELLNASDKATSLFSTKETILTPNALMHEHYMQQYDRYKHWYSVYQRQ